MSVRLHTAPHRVPVDQVTPAAKRTTAAKALDQLTADGLDQVCSSDLEVYRLVMLPAEFKRLCNRLDAALNQPTQDPDETTSALMLPFGSDLQPSVDRERRRRWAHRPNSEPLPTTWTVHEIWRIPGRMVLVQGREFTATGVRGRLRSRHAIVTTTGNSWVEAFDRDGRYRSLSPDRVRTVHRKSRLRGGRS